MKLNPETWTPEQRQAVMNNLAKFLDDPKLDALLLKSKTYRDKAAKRIAKRIYSRVQYLIEDLKAAREKTTDNNQTPDM